MLACGRGPKTKTAKKQHKQRGRNSHNDTSPPFPPPPGPRSNSAALAGLELTGRLSCSLFRHPCHTSPSSSPLPLQTHTIATGTPALPSPTPVQPVAMPLPLTARMVPARAAATATCDELLVDGAELVTAIDFWERSFVGYHLFVPTTTQPPNENW